MLRSRNMLTIFNNLIHTWIVAVLVVVGLREVEVPTAIVTQYIALRVVCILGVEDTIPRELLMHLLRM